MFKTDVYDSCTVQRHEHGEFSEENTAMVITTTVNGGYYAFFCYAKPHAIEAQMLVSHWPDEEDHIPLSVFAIAY